jgi:hypothetical protein
MSWGQLGWPSLLRSGAPGVLAGVGYALLVAGLVKWLAARGVRLRI